MESVESWVGRGAYITVDGERVWTLDVPADGSTPVSDPLLVLHGFPTSAYDWHQVVAALAGRRRVVLFDMPGYGASDKPDRAYSLFHQADVAEAVAAAFGLRRVVLVSHDMGDTVGGELLARDLDGRLPFAVSRRILTNGSIYIGQAHLTQGQQMLLGMPDALLDPGVTPSAEALGLTLRAILSPETGVADDETRAMGELVVRGGGARLLPRLIRYVEERREHESRWTGAIERHPSPLTVIWGDADQIARWDMVERLQAARPDAECVRLRGVGHYPMAEVPADFTQALLHGT
ncbi:MAG: alpha/beta hydrolase [Acidimicrobiia bacterium]|nr:alpha/beta hydrolase [Acidimicrobiia bacterium]